MPDGPIRGAAHDMWQVAMTKITEPGRYLRRPRTGSARGAKAPGYQICQSPTMSLLPGIRLMPENPQERVELLEQVAIYPYGARYAPPTRLPAPGGTRVDGGAAAGMSCWERLAEMVEREPVFERDPSFTAMLRPLGIEKGRPFAPDERQQRILEQAVFVGEAMAKADVGAPSAVVAFWSITLHDVSTRWHPAQRPGDRRPVVVDGSARRRRRHHPHRIRSARRPRTELAPQPGDGVRNRSVEAARGAGCTSIAACGPD